MGNPKVFISYSWDDEPHKKWVRQLGQGLRSDGVDVILDQWHTVAGDQLPAFMESSIRDSDHILIVCTPNYMARSNERRGGVGYEGTVMTAEVAARANDRKFIPILRKGRWEQAAPSWLLGKRYIDLSGDPYAEGSYDELLQTIHGLLEQAPPLGPVPDKARFAGKLEVPAAPRKKSLEELPLEEQILVRHYDLWTQDPKSAAVASERFFDMGDKDDVHDAIIELGRRGLESHGEPLTLGKPNYIERIAPIRITLKGKTTARTIMQSLA